jgi:hypothetical protein
MRKLVYPHHHHYCVCVYVYLGLCWYVQVIPQEDQVPWWSNNTLFFFTFLAVGQTDPNLKEFIPKV